VLTGIIEALILFALAIGGLLGGLFSPTQAGAIGAGGALIIGLARRQLSWQSFFEAGKEATGTPCKVFCVRDADRSFFKDVGVEDPPEGYLKKQIAEGGGGFIIQSQDGSVTVDYTFKGIIERKMEPLRIGVAKSLFAKE